MATVLPGVPESVVGGAVALSARGGPHSHISFRFERLPARVFDFTTGNRRDLYFAILPVFNDANERLETALRHLESLGLLESSQSYTASYATAAEFAGVRLVLKRLKERGALHALMADDDSGADSRVFTTLQELEGHLDSLREFNNELQRLLRSDGADLDGPWPRVLDTVVIDYAAAGITVARRPPRQ